MKCYLLISLIILTLLVMVQTLPQIEDPTNPEFNEAEFPDYWGYGKTSAEDPIFDPGFYRIIAAIWSQIQPPEDTPYEESN